MITRPKQFRVESRLRNNRLIAAREALGLSCPQAADAIGVGYSLLVNLEGFKRSAMNKTTGTWTSSALKIADYYKVPPDWLWSEDALAIENGRKVTLELDAAEIVALQRTMPMSPMEAIDDQEKKGAIQEALQGLTKREFYVVSRLFGLDGEEEATYRELGDDLEVSYQRVRQIVMKALRKLRHPATANLLSPWDPEN